MSLKTQGQIPNNLIEEVVHSIQEVLKSQFTDQNVAIEQALSQFSQKQLVQQRQVISKLDQQSQQHGRPLPGFHLLSEHECQTEEWEPALQQENARLGALFEETQMKYELEQKKNELNTTEMENLHALSRNQQERIKGLEETLSSQKLLFDQLKNIR